MNNPIPIGAKIHRNNIKFMKKEEYESLLSNQYICKGKLLRAIKMKRPATTPP